MNAQTVNKLRKLKYNFEYYAPKLLRIRTKEGKLVNFDLNTMQKKIDATIERLKTEGKPVRLIILKYRQGGASTYTEGRIFHSTTMNHLTNSLIVAHEEAASTNLFNMSKMFYDELPNELKPMRKNSNSKELVFENPTASTEEKRDNPGLRSRIKISTANNEDAGRSATVHNLHASEVAFWKNAEKVMLSLMQAVPNTPNTMVILESTANGVGGYFYDQWQRAKKGESDFVPLFFAWFEEPEYEMDVPHDFTPTQEETELIRQYPEITMRKIVWRRWCIANNCGGDVEKFKQEYPSNDTEAFLVSGRPRFDIKALSEYLNQCMDGVTGYLEDGFTKHPKGYVEVWEYPKASKSYYIGADVAKGLITGDYSAGVVIDDDYNIAAIWHGHIDPDLFANELIKLGNWYNEALVVVEENNHGLSVLNAMKERYSNLYKRTTHNKVTDQIKEELGWYTSDQTKRLAIDHFAKLIRERKIGVRSRKMIQECMTYVLDDTGKTNAQEGSHDDIVMSAAIVCKAVEQVGGALPTIALGESKPITQSNESFILQQNGTFRHISEIQDERNNDDGDWFRKAGW